MSTATRGFASMSKERRRAVGRQGALRAHQNGNAYEWTSETAGLAGEIGGVVSGEVRRAKRIAFRKAHPYNEAIEIPAHWRYGRSRDPFLSLPKPPPAPPPAPVVDAAPVPVPAPVAPAPPVVDPLILLAEHLKRVVRDALIRGGHS